MAHPRACVASLLVAADIASAAFPPGLENLPLTDWPSSPEARSWLLSDVAPFAGPPLVCLVALPLLLILGVLLTACGARKRLQRSRGLACAGVGALGAVCLLGSALYVLVMLLGTATAFESTAVNLTNEASLFACSTPGGAEVGQSCTSQTTSPPPSAQFWPPPPPAVCEDNSLIGFASQLGSSTETVASATIHFVANLSASALAFAPVLNTSAAATAVAGEVAGNLSSLNASLAGLGDGLGTATSTAQLYWEGCDSLADPGQAAACATAWTALRLAQGIDVVQPPEADLWASQQLASDLDAAHVALAAAVEAAFAAVEEQTGPIISQVVTRVPSLVPSECRYEHHHECPVIGACWHTERHSELQPSAP